MRMSVAGRTGLALGLLALGACTVGPDYKSPGWTAPGSWFSRRPDLPKPGPSVPVAEPMDAEWWTLFRDPQLTSLERRVVAQNLDVRTAAVRIAEARAQLGIARASLFPNINGNGSYTREKASNEGVFTAFPGASGSASSPGTSASGAAGTLGAGGIPASGIPPFDIYQYGLSASWELDLWGRVRRSVESAQASELASVEAQRGVLLSALADVARDYMQLRGAQLRLAIARENLQSSEQSLQLTQQRAAGGVTTDLDVANASAQVHTISAEIPGLEQQAASLINALSLLLGQPPNALRADLEQAKPVPPVPPEVPVGLPGELVRRRPDIRQAEAQLHAATADIGVAVANFYPTVTLNGSVGFQALQWNTLWDLNARQYSFGPGISVPIFQGGQLRSTLQLRKAQQQEAAIAWQKALLQAWHDVDNALTAYRTEQARRDQLSAAVEQNRRALGLAQSRYQQGVTSFLDVLDAQRSLLATQQSLADATTTVSTNLVALYRALGGGWETDLPVMASRG
jgi:NodT family efflux transporter outer membrane factor (OMF) lipoprotein